MEKTEQKVTNKKDQTSGNKPPRQEGSQQQKKDNSNMKVDNMIPKRDTSNPSNKSDNSKNSSQKSDNKSTSQKTTTSTSQKATTSGTINYSNQSNRVAFFDHLPQKFSNNISDSIASDGTIHPAIIKLGGLYKSGIIYDDDDRACSLLVTFCNVIEDYTAPPNKNISWDLDRHIKAQVHI
jgi:hypothetical protein